MTQRPPGLPSPEQVTELLEDDFARAGYEIEDVTVEKNCRPPRVTVVADGDTPPSLDDLAELSRAAASLLDPLDTGGYVLEVTSPGVDRPLTAERHFRRARGRRVEIHLADATVLGGRLGRIADGAVEVAVRGGGGWTVRKVPLADIRHGVVQVEFSPPSPEELAVLGDAAGRAGAAG
ncbi:MAG: ribosome maturation factor RimP [Mycobacterium sp.]